MDAFSPTPAAARPIDRPTDPGRLPLPAGDPQAWALLVEDTSLQGTAWPGYPPYGWDSPLLGRDR